MSPHTFVYMFKYVAKGPDYAQYRIMDDNADVQHQAAAAAADYISARYLSATEATFRIFGLKITHKTPKVTRLAVHEPQQNRAQFRRRGGTQSSASTLLRYFLRPDQFAHLTYIRYYERILSRAATPTERANPALLPAGFYLEHSEPGARFNPNVVHERIRGKTVARIKSVRPSAGEAFYIRALLKHKPARSWNELRTSANGILHATFKDAAIADGYIEGENEANLAMAEAIQLHTAPTDLRFLYTLLIHEGAHALALWTSFAEPLSRDFLPLNEDFDTAPLQNVRLAERSALRQIDDLLRGFGLSNIVVGLPAFPRNVVGAEEELHHFAPLRPQLRNQAAAARAHFTPEQHNIRATIVNAVTTAEDNLPRLHLIQGRAGRGKTFVLQAIIDELRGHGYPLAICGATGLSASNFTRGMTVHKRFSIPVPDENDEPVLPLRSSMRFQSPSAAFLIAASAIVIDEIWALPNNVISAIDVLLQELMGRAQPFGGKVVIGVGDPRQTAPVTKENTRQATVEASFLASPLLPLFTIHELSIPQRQAGDNNFREWVDAIGDRVDLPMVDTAEMITSLDNLDDAQSFLFPADVLANNSIAATRSFLTPLNTSVDTFNDRIVDSLPSPRRTLASYDAIKDGEDIAEEDATAALEAVALTPHTGVPPHLLNLKIGELCSILRNISVPHGLIKHARVTITSINQRSIGIRLLTSGRFFLLPRITFVFKPSFSPFSLLRKQIPLRPAYASTFHGCQGLTLARTVIDCTVPVFTHGQRYAAISRTRQRQDARCYVPPATVSVVNNIVYPEFINIAQ